MFTTIFPFPPMVFCSFPSLRPFTISCQSLKALSLLSFSFHQPAATLRNMPSPLHLSQDEDCPLPFIPSRRNLNLMHHFRNLHRCLALGKSLLRKHLNNQAASLIQVLPAGVEALNITSVDNKTLSLSNICHSFYFISLSWLNCC